MFFATIILVTFLCIISKTRGKPSTVACADPDCFWDKLSGSPGWGAAACYFVVRRDSPFSFAVITCGSVVMMDWVNV